MNKRIPTTLAAIGLALTATVATAPMASASTTSCTNTWVGWPSLHAYGTRLHYSPGKTAIYLSATQRVVKDNPWPFADVIYTFNRASSPSGLQTRYSQPTQWGNIYNPLNTAARTITVTWKGYDTNGNRKADRNCTMVLPQTY